MKVVPATRSINTQLQLALLIRELKQAVAAGVLEQIRPDPSLFLTDLGIDEIEESGPWPDYLELKFRVIGEERKYKLSVETYHGVGGSWTVE